MKSKFTRHLLIFLAIIFSTHLFGNIGKGYLITLDGKNITGKIKNIYFSEWYASLTFENDFGNSYSIHPATILGFVFKKENEDVVFESKLIRGSWVFLRIVEKGPGLTLYRSTERTTELVKVSNESIVTDKKIDEMWLQFYRKRPFRVYRMTYKKVLKKKLSAFPTLAQMIGKQGYKYRDLTKIVTLYNELYMKGEKRL